MVRARLHPHRHLTLDDEAIAAYLRGAKVPVILAVNKIDNNEIHEAYRFYSLGFGEPYPVSAAQGKGIGDLLDAVTAAVPAAPVEEDEDVIKIAIVGKPNAGKSSMVNRLLGCCFGTLKMALIISVVLNIMTFCNIDGDASKRSVLFNPISGILSKVLPFADFELPEISLPDIDLPSLDVPDTDRSETASV